MTNAIAIDTTHFGNEIDDLPLFVLGMRKELMLVIKEGVVRLSSPNNANNQSLDEVIGLLRGNQRRNESIHSHVSVGVL